MDQLTNNFNLINHAIFQKLKSLGLNANDFLVFGSGTMFAAGLRPLSELADLDLWISRSATEKLKKLAQATSPQSWGGSHFDLSGSGIEAFTDWGPRAYAAENSFDDVRSRAIIIGDIPFASLKDVREWKLKMGRDKDLEHVKLINDYLKREALAIISKR